MSTARSDDLDRGPGVLGYLGQVVELAAHDLGAADGAVQHAFVEDGPELGSVRAVQH